MPDAVKRRTIDSPLRREQAAETRRRILAAARRLFVSRGYVATTMPAIAKEAGVAIETVYVSVGPKPTILSILADQAVAGDEPSPASHRDRVKRLLAERPPGEWLSSYASELRSMHERVADIETAMRHAAAADSTIASLWAEKMGARLHGLRPLARSLASEGMLAPGISPDRAADLIWMLGSPETYELLIAERGWEGEEYQRWLTVMLERTLLA